MSSLCFEHYRSELSINCPFSFHPPLLQTSATDDIFSHFTTLIITLCLGKLTIYKHIYHAPTTTHSFTQSHINTIFLYYYYVFTNISLYVFFSSFISFLSFLPSKYKSILIILYCMCDYWKKMNCKYITNLQGSYLEGIRTQIGGITQKVKSWYCGRPLVSLAICCSMSM